MNKIPYLVIDKTSPHNIVVMRVEEKSIEGFFLGRRLKNYTVVLDETTAVCLSDAIQDQPALCDTAKLADFLKTQRLLATLKGPVPETTREEHVYAAQLRALKGGGPKAGSG